jgi:hypothetical protein
MGEGKLETQDDILYHWEEPKASKIRQLRQCVIPVSLHPTVYAAYHSTPLTGHVSIYKTYWQIVTHYWWPNMSVGICTVIAHCSHCIVGNNTHHNSQQILTTISTDELSDIISMDIWHPGITQGNSTSKKVDLARLKKITLTYLCNTTGFTPTAFIK